ncbi:hypothetical protein OK349_12205 [Sphingomonas sp. BT-65]|uniref:hypothetical protein n=1 Tax=Sphingomonas sp. BT-65 TaxID=2989821 RepID=UPI002235B973|nr:hypothetical protein [Sphingomonas sp. BT-65]MCW4462471.1 hypothetical protein [Sphingomonas sp. BT-65]
MAKGLSTFSVTADGKGDYLISIEDEDGETTEFTASYEQLDLISESIDDALDDDEEDALGVDEEADEESEA